MFRVPRDAAASQRALWLAELMQALEEAKSLVWQMSLSRRIDIDTLDLLAELETASAEARRLQAHQVRAEAEIHPEWTKPHLWDGQQPEPCA